ncbi:DUF5683 domain-containing protein [Arenibacter sp. GZD96]|uniref:DUF5683 domain-containing protein n=1 Tax=Aurantibrevibacter litoralis TaxID=3106030 RepID=UPI002AFF96B7|nr:DUF5683 domain-containing protein [Arenibacter sp. GZD-96]MEA1785070.1 DUF5683 domain-containing protein [Arenibacter sp. GZD-96]
MHNSLILLLTLFFFVALASAQETEVDTQTPDSVRVDLKKKGIVINDSVLYKRKEINPLAPSKAAFYSAVIPGLGQIYNRRYWKVPIVYAAIGTGVYAYTWNNDQYNRFRDAFKSRQAGFTNDEFFDLNGDGNPNGLPDFSNEALESGQERFQRDRDLALLITIGLYVLNIVDANVDAHLKQFNVDDNLSMDFKPFLDLDPITANPTYGMALILKF